MRNYTESPPEAPLSPDNLPDTGETDDFIRKPHLKPQLYQDTLGEILAIPPETIAVNRMGKLTRDQHSHIMAALTGDSDAMRLFLNILLAVSLLLALIFLSEKLPMIYLVIGAGLFIGSMIAVWWRRQNRLREDLRLRIDRVEGVPRLHDFGRLDTVRQYGLIIHSLYIPLSRQEYDRLQQYELPLCRVYFTARTKQVLSIEVLQRPDDDKLKNDLALDEDEKAKNDENLPEESEQEKIQQK